jgi:hypothetical protein
MGATCRRSPNQEVLAKANTLATGRLSPTSVHRVVGTGPACSKSAPIFQDSASPGTAAAVAPVYMYTRAPALMIDAGDRNLGSAAWGNPPAQPLTPIDISDIDQQGRCWACMRARLRAIWLEMIQRLEAGFQGCSARSSSVPIIVYTGRAHGFPPIVPAEPTAR